MEIIQMTRMTKEVYQAFQNLIPQLTQNSAPPSYEDLEAMAGSSNIYVFLAYNGDIVPVIVGSATLATFQTPTGKHGWIEDVIVDKDVRRQGLGQKLTQACLDKAKQIGLTEVNLTSRPSREAANALYQSMGFQKRQTNVYRFALD
jgi:ribosomal protein S18 acetylase RimI-like enzyme